jgi:hypothetical protein
MTRSGRLKAASAKGENAGAEVSAEDADLVCYAGAGYSRPRRLCVESLSFSDYDTPGELASALNAFSIASVNAGAAIEVKDSELADCHSYMSGFSSFRNETAEEVADRVASYRVAVQRRAQEDAQRRRADYERLKREFSDG